MNVKTYKSYCKNTLWQILRRYVCILPQAFNEQISELFNACSSQIAFSSSFNHFVVSFYILLCPLFIHFMTLVSLSLIKHLKKASNMQSEWVHFPTPIIFIASNLFSFVKLKLRFFTHFFLDQRQYRRWFSFALFFFSFILCLWVIAVHYCALCLFFFVQ